MYYFDLGIKFIINYFISNHPFEDNTVALEQKIIFSLDKEKKYNIRGYVDRLVYNKDTKVLEIHESHRIHFRHHQIGMALRPELIHIRLFRNNP